MPIRKKLPRKQKSTARKALSKIGAVAPKKASSGARKTVKARKIKNRGLKGMAGTAVKSGMKKL